MVPQWGGFLAAAVAVVLFGSNALPIKRFETGDGVFFQWVACAAIWVTGFIANCALGLPPFAPWAMLGGALWCTGNMMVVPIVKMIGLGLGLVLWGMGNLVMGWASGNFGLFGLDEESVPHPALNYIGFALALLATVLFMFVKPTIESNSKQSDDAERQRLLVQGTSPHGNDSDSENEGASWVDRLSVVQQRVAGVVLSLISGCFYGVNFDPPALLAQSCKKGNGPKGCSPELIDYVFSHFTGIFLMSTFFLAIYCGVSKNKPSVYPQSILPGMAYGVMWGCADIAWFIANGALSLVVAFPLITTGPGVVAGLWGIFLYREIRGNRNLLTWLGAVLVTVGSVSLIALSKIK